jgi:hypothetical protein
METPTFRIEDHAIIYNMVGQKTAALVALLNLFSLNSRADALYDALKAKGKYDPKTTAAARQNTVDAERRNKVNAETDQNPNFVPLSSLPKPYTDAELKKMRDQEATEPETADTKADQEMEAKLKKEMPKGNILNASGATPTDAGPSAPSLPAKPSKSHGPSVDLAQPKTPAIKVTNDDPDEVSFGDDDATAKKTKTASPKPNANGAPKK